MRRITTALIGALFLLSGCSGMKPQDFADRKPDFRPERFFAGKSEAWGIFEDRFGNLRTSFKVKIDGQWNAQSQTLVLTEDFVYDDGKTEQRVWTLVKQDDNTYQGTAGDVIGSAVGLAYGNAMNWRYDFRMKVNDMQFSVNFNDWMFQMDERVMINRASVTKFGVEIGTASIFFMRSQ